MDAVTHAFRTDLSIESSSQSGVASVSGAFSSPGGGVAAIMEASTLLPAEGDPVSDAPTQNVESMTKVGSSFAETRTLL